MMMTPLAPHTENGGRRVFQVSIDSMSTIEEVDVVIEQAVYHIAVCLPLMEFVPRTRISGLHLLCRS